MALFLILTLFPGSVFAMTEGEQGHNHTEGYCYVCKAGDPYESLFSYNVTQDYDMSSEVMIGEISYPSLEDALQAAVPGDTLCILDNIFLQSPLRIEKDITLTGRYPGDYAGDYAYAVISRGFSGEAMITVRGGANVNIEDLTLDGGSDSGYSGYSIFHVLDGSGLTLSSGTTLKNSRAGYGGGVYVDGSSRVQMEGEAEISEIRQCSAVYSGGGIYSEGSVVLSPGAYITGNTAAYGGGIWTLNGDVILADYSAVNSNTDSSGLDSNILDASAEPLPAETDPYSSWDGNDDPGSGTEGAQIHTVYFDPGDGGELVPVQVTDGTAVAQPQEISWEGYVFAGWTYVPYEDGVVYPYDFSQPVYSDLTIYANWVPVETTAPDVQTDGQTPAEPGYDPIWDPQYSQQQYDTQTVQQYNTQTGQEQVYYTVNYEYNAEGFEPFVDTVQAGDYAKNPYDPDIMHRDHYDFAGWFYYTNEGEFQFDFDQPVYQDYYLTAKWNEVQPSYASYVTVTYDPNDGASQLSTLQIEAGETAAEASATRDGYTFEGWYYYDEYGDYVLYDFDQEVYSDVTLYAEWSPLPEYTVYFDFNADGQIPEQTKTVREGQTVSDPYDPQTMALSGRDFLGWFYTDEYGDEYQFSFDYDITSDWELYAKWTQVETDPSPEEKMMAEEPLAEEPQMKPMILKGLRLGATRSLAALSTTQTEENPDPATQTESELINVPNRGAGEIPPEEGDTIPTPVTVALDQNGGNDGQQSVQVTKGLTMTDLDTLPVFENHIFEGYFASTEQDAKQYYDKDGKGICVWDQDTGGTLYAHWSEIPDYQVEFMGNGADSGSMDPVKGKPGDTVTIPENGFVRNGWEFTVWAEADGTTHAPGDQLILEKSAYTFYAQWKELPADATLMYHANGGDGTMAPGTGKQGSSIEVAANGFTRTGYVFTGWNTLADGTGTAYAPGTAFKLAGTTNDLYAQWEVQAFVVTFDPCNGSNSILQTVPYGQKAVEPAVQAPAGYRLEGWYREAACVNRFDLANTPITGSITLFAKWEPIPVENYTVSFYTDKGTAPAAQTVQKGQMAYKPADPYAEGYLFGGWYLDQAYTSLYSFNTPVTGNIALYAKWAPRPDLNHVVSFNANGHGGAPEPQTVKGGSLAQKPEAPKAVGYTFTGWFTDPQCTRAYNFQEPVTEDMTLYAGWTVNRYTIRFDSNTGVGTMPSIQAAYDQKVSLPANTFTKSGYYFLGWNTASDGTGVFIADQGEVLNLTDVNGGTVDLYAQWKNIYNVIEGANAQVMKGSGKGLTFRCDGDYSKFTGIKIDGRNVSTSQYTSAPGSTVVTLHEDYVNQMPVGTHTLRFEYTDGGVDTTFELVSRTPTTGDTNNTLLWIIIGIAALVIICAVTAVLLIRRRRLTDDDPYFDDFGPGSNNFSRDYDDGDYDDEEDDYGRDDHDGYDQDYDDGFDGYESRRRADILDDQEDDYETDEDRYERYVDDQLKRRGNRK